VAANFQPWEQNPPASRADEDVDLPLRLVNQGGGNLSPGQLSISVEAYGSAIVGGADAEAGAASATASFTVTGIDWQAEPALVRSIVTEQAQYVGRSAYHGPTTGAACDQALAAVASLGTVCLPVPAGATDVQATVVDATGAQPGGVLRNAQAANGQDQAFCGGSPTEPVWPGTSTVVVFVGSQCGAVPTTGTVTAAFTVWR
jgi:hypothetical protein